MIWSEMEKHLNQGNWDILCHSLKSLSQLVSCNILKICLHQKNYKQYSSKVLEVRRIFLCFWKSLMLNKATFIC